MTGFKLDADERALLDAYETSDLQSELTKERSDELAYFAQSSMAREHQLSINISKRDLELLQRRALKEGLSYQALIASVLHKYVSGSLEDVSSHNRYLGNQG